MAGVLMEGWNIYATPNLNSWWFATQIAWQYIPTESYYLERVEFYLGRIDRDPVTIQLRDESYGWVANVLSGGTFHHTADYTWQGADITPYYVTEGHFYWITMWYADGIHVPITSDLDGELIGYTYGIGHDGDRYYDGAGPDMPWIYFGFKPMAKFYGETNIVPEPASLLLFGLGGIAAALIKRRR